MPESKKRDIIHVRVGTPDWQPTDSDIQHVTELFDAALNSDDEDGALVITNGDIHVSLERVEEGPELRLFVVSLNRLSHDQLSEPSVDVPAASVTEYATELDEEDFDLLANAPWSKTLQ